MTSRKEPEEPAGEDGVADNMIWDDFEGTGEGEHTLSNGANVRTFFWDLTKMHLRKKSIYEQLAAVEETREESEETGEESEGLTAVTKRLADA